MGAILFRSLLVTVEADKETFGTGLHAHGKAPADQADHGASASVSILDVRGHDGSSDLVGKQYVGDACNRFKVDQIDDSQTVAMTVTIKGVDLLALMSLLCRCQLPSAQPLFSKT